VGDARLVARLPPQRQRFHVESRRSRIVAAHFGHLTEVRQRIGDALLILQGTVQDQALLIEGDYTRDVLLQVEEGVRQGAECARDSRTIGQRAV
jgi:hypothetical protein